MALRHASIALLGIYYISFTHFLPHTEATISENFCDVSVTFNIFETTCMNCWQNRKVRCPRGARKLTRGAGTRGCRYSILVGSATQDARGCVHKCREKISTTTCCDGYWGQDCQSCPRDGSGLVCGGRGNCDDGYTGNGTCSCGDNMEGSFCEICTNPQFYGPTCGSVCACQHGTCDSGINGTGSCYCESGYGGRQCERALAECSTLSCHPNSSCLDVTGTVSCLCNKGYTGDGQTCAEINPCVTSPHSLCNENATCVHTGPDQSSCTCKAGYSGDGNWCQPVDPCQTDNGGCVVESTVCKMTGPGQSRCDCKYGFENYVQGVGCQLSDVCGKYPKTTCDPDATCETVVDGSEITVKCTCPPGSLEVNRVCYYDLLFELGKMNETGRYANKLNFAIQMFQSMYGDLQTYNPNWWTLFVPVDSAFMERPPSSDSPVRTPRTTDDILWKIKARSMIVSGMIPTNLTLSSAKTMYPILGHDYPISLLKPGQISDTDEDDDDDGYFADLKFEGKFVGKVLVDAKPAVNGFIYLIDTILEPADTKSLYPNGTIMEALNSFPSLSNYTMLMTRSYSFQRKLMAIGSRWRSHLLFVPTNDAFLALSDDEIMYLTSYEGRSSLELLLSYTMMVRRPIPTVISISRSQILRSTEAIPVNISEVDGTVFLGRERGKVLKSEIIVSSEAGAPVYIYIIDKLLIPESIKPIVKNRCTANMERKVRGPCGNCGQTLCPNDGTPLPQAVSDIKVCVYPSEVQTADGQWMYEETAGCSRLCGVTEVTETCCMGFYGSQCRSCPGPVGKPCNSNGICLDKEAGTGLCTCNSNFNGSACEICLNATKFGQNCDQDCLCVNGTCRNTIDSHGECVPGSCANGWAGENCDRKIVYCANGTLKCNQFASCVVQDNGNASCVCDPGYTGSGLSCYPFNPCEDLRTSGCSLNAYCMHLGRGAIRCECLPNYEGDGRSCAPTDNCASTDRGGCSENANCMFRGPGEHECQCKRGFQGNGITCTEINLCLENNGGCSFRAKCTKNGPLQVSCQCYDGYEGDGSSCTGNLLQEIALRSDLSQLQNWILRWQSIKYFLMNLSPGFTCFLPSDSAWTSLTDDQQDFWINERHLLYLLKNHIVQERLLSADLMRLKGQPVASMLDTVTILINKVTIGVSDKNLASNTTEQVTLPTLGKDYVKILAADLPVTGNGVIHVIDSVFIPPKDVVKDYQALSTIIAGGLAGTGFEQYSDFIGYLNTTGVLNQLEDADNTPYTLFMGPNVAFTSLLADTNLTTVVQYHVIKGKLIRGMEVISGQHETTLLGPGYKVTLVRFHDSVIVNGLSVLTDANRTATGIVYRLSSKYLKPVKTTCDGYSTGFKYTTCLPCFYPHRCPTDSDLVSKTHCLFSHTTGGGAIKTSVGCRLKCSYKVRQSRCCPGFYGAGCDPCPGGVGNVCSKVGSCFDGTKGNGTCKCSDAKYTGTACENCVAGRYGVNCDQQCKCVNGKCNDGPFGDGTCSCYLGYRGQYCDQKIDSSDACGNTCHSSANCVPASIGSDNVCVCIAGYKGNGTDCEAVNACADPGVNSGCSAQADCTFISAGVHNCTCKDNYEGDGRVCTPINPCFNGFASNCDVNAECIMTGPNASHCVCRDNYKGDGKSCSPVNPCDTNNGGCSENAVCKNTGPNTKECKCEENYFGDGVLCIGSIFSYISGRPEFEWFTLMDSFASLAPRILTHGSPLMVFLPSQSLMMQLNNHWLTYEEPATQLYLNHIVGCTDGRNLTGVTRLRTLAGDVLNISKTDSGYMINGNINVLGDGQVFWNGILYQIDAPLIPTSIPKLMNRTTPHTKIIKMLQPYLENSSDSSDPLYKNTKVLLESGFQWVVTLLEVADQLRSLQYPLHNPWTLFLPTDDAFSLQPTQRLRSFIDIEQPLDAIEYIKYHMVRETFIDPTAFMSSQGMDALLRTMQGSNINLRCAAGSDRIGDLVVNDGMATVIGFDVFHFTTDSNLEKKAAIYILDKVLDPPSIGGRCDESVKTNILTQCSLCVATQQTCPVNTTLLKRSECNMDFPSSDGLSVSVPGCQVSCTTFEKKHKCCYHHYGDSCHACPGGAANPCSGNGQCSEGVNGTGECKCKSGFIGTACERCKTGSYGRNCMACKCTLHGHCNEGIDNDGTCYCDAGWTGKYCDEKVSPGSDCDPPCHKNGYCASAHNCLCKPNYNGDGVNTCQFMDMCNVDNGGCSRYAFCSIEKEKVVCKCRPGYVGDGYSCEGMNPCTSLFKRCHVNAYCIYTSANVSQCICLSGYNGDGITCTKNQAATCAVNNGGCSPRASCVDVPPTSPKGIPTTQCSCLQGYMGDGKFCYGTLFDYVSQDGNSRGFYRMLLNLPLQLRAKLNNPKLNMTLFLPASIPRWGRRYTDVRRHMVSDKVYYFNALQGDMKLVVADSSDLLPIKVVAGDVFINGVRIKSPDIVATNGVIQFMEGFITPTGSVTTPTTPTTTSRSTRTKRTTSAKTPSSSIPTVSPGQPIDKEVTTKASILTPTTKGKSTTSISSKSSTATSTKNTPVQDKTSRRKRANGIKIGVSVAVIALIMIIVGVVYWWKYRHTGGFTVFSDRVAVEENEEFAGLSNPAYDSTGFNRADEALIHDADPDAALAMLGDEGPISFENPKTG